MSPPRCVMFDLDGVLVRSEEVWFRLVEESGRRFRGSAVTREEFAPTFGQGTGADVRVFKFDCTPDALNVFYAENFQRYAGEVWTNPQARPLLAALHAQGKRLAVVTNTASPLALQILKTAELEHLFDQIVCADQVPHPKPAPDLLEEALLRLACQASEAWMVGDSRYDREAAHAAGVFFVGLGIDGDLRIQELEALTASLS